MIRGHATFRSRIWLMGHNKLLLLTKLVGAVASASITASAAEPFDTSQARLTTGEVHKRTLLNGLGPVLRSSRKAGRLYYSDACAGTQLESVSFPALIVRRASKHE